MLLLSFVGILACVWTTAAQGVPEARGVFVSGQELEHSPGGIDTSPLPTVLVTATGDFAGDANAALSPSTPLQRLQPSPSRLSDNTKPLYIETTSTITTTILTVSGGITATSVLTTELPVSQQADSLNYPVKDSSALHLRVVNKALVSVFAVLVAARLASGQ